MSALRALRRFARYAVGSRFAEHAERCEICGEQRLSAHGHVVDRTAHRLCCVCAPCSVAFQGATHGRYLSVPTRVALDPTFCLTRAAWARLEIPVELAFIVRDSKLSRWVAFYPSAAGATQAELSQTAWRELIAAHPALCSLADDVEAVLVRGAPEAPFDCFVAPIDVCYELVGVVRRHWRGFSGGERVHQEIAQFFEALARRSVLAIDERAPLELASGAGDSA